MGSPTKHRGILPLPTPTKGALVRAETDRTAVAMLEFQSPTAALIAEPAPIMARATLYIITTAILACFAAMYFVKVDMIVTAEAVTQSASPDIVIQPLQTAVVKTIDVKEGEFVKKGQLLAQLDPTMTTATSTATVAQAASLRAQVDRMKAEMANHEYVSDGTPYGDAQAQMWQERHANFTQQVDSLKQKVEADRYRVEQLKADELGYADRLPLAQTVENKRRQLASQGLDSQLNLLAAMDQRVQIEASLADTRQQLQGAEHDLKGDIDNLQAFVTQWYSQTSDQLATQERALQDMAGQATSNQYLNQLVQLVAPEDSYVMNISTIAIGSVVQSGGEMMRLVPSKSAIDVVGFVQGSDAGYLKKGDFVSVKFDTLDYIIYGFAVGRVKTISADSFANLPPPQSSPLPTQPTLGISQPQALPAISPVTYKVTTSIDELRVHNVPPSFKVVPGMPITADIKVGRRSVLEYFFERLMPPFYEGMREPT